MSSMWNLSVDLGTTTTAAATRRDEAAATILEIGGSPRLPSSVWASPTGELAVGTAAETQLAIEPSRGEATPKRRLGDGVVLLGDLPFDPVDLLAALLRPVRAEALRSNGDEAPGAVVLTHPAPWGRARTELLQEAARRAGLGEVGLVPEPVAAAAQLMSTAVGEGELVAVYDLGGGTLDTAVVRRSEGGFVVAGPPGGTDRMGGEVFDDVIARHLAAQLPDDVRDSMARSPERTWQQAALAMRRTARAMKEALSDATTHTAYVRPPVDAELVLTRSELEDLLSRAVADTVAELERTVERSGVRMEQVSAVVMVGGAARMPLVGRILEDRLGRPPVTWGDPKAVVALGALQLTTQSTERAETRRPAPGPSTAPLPRPPAPEPVEAIKPVGSVRSEVPLIPLQDVPASPPDPVRSPAAEATDEAGAARQRVGTVVAIALVAAGLVCVLLLLLTA